MRYLVVALLLQLTACSANSHYSLPWRVTQINDLYEARDACLARHAVPYAANETSASEIARAVSLSCQAETDKLIASSNPGNDPEVTSAIRRDTEFRATGYVLKARGEVNPF